MKKYNEDINRILLLERKKLIEIKENGEIIRKHYGRKRKIYGKTIIYSDNKGYLRVVITINGKEIVERAHRVIWTKFNGKIPKDATINHKDGNKMNNNINNLELMTMKEQVRHATYVIKTKNDMIGKKNISAKIDMEIARKIRELRRKGMKHKEIQEKLNLEIGQSEISKIINGKYWKEENELVQA